ncbi:MAG TPA: hypothetical protein VMT54_20110 [Candidatus Cybelea sp.]|nr:hypothetical protein [Candidatus Cybelea sp.]
MPNDAMAEFQQIVQTRDTALRQLQTVEKPLLARIRTLSDKRRNGTITPSESSELDTANQGLERVHHGMWIVGQISLQAMNDSNLLRDIVSGLNGISDGLNDAKQTLDRIANVANITAQVTSALVELAQKVGSVLAA